MLFSGHDVRFLAEIYLIIYKCIKHIKKYANVCFSIFWRIRSAMMVRCNATEVATEGATTKEAASARSAPLL